MDEMRNIWHQVSVKDRAKYKRSEPEQMGSERVLSDPLLVSEVPETEVDVSTEAPVIAIRAESQAFEKAREAMAKKWDANAANRRVSDAVHFDGGIRDEKDERNIELTKSKAAGTPTVPTGINSTRRVDSKEVLRRSLDEKKEEEKAAIAADALADAERERAGYEKVELNINGQPISYWKKKKE